MQTLIKAVNVDKPHTTGQITYDVEKLKWFNRKWIALTPNDQLVALCRPYLAAAYTQSDKISDSTLALLFNVLKTDMVALADCVPLLKFYFEAPEILATDLEACIPAEQIGRIKEIVASCLPSINDSALFAQNLKDKAKQADIPFKEACWLCVGAHGFYQRTNNS